MLNMLAYAMCSKQPPVFAGQAGYDLWYVRLLTFESLRR